MKIAYFVHNLEDPAVAKRVAMLRAGGADVTLLGFYRGEAASAPHPDVKTFSLGRTYDARFAQRIGKVLQNLARVGRLKPALAGVDVILARNLEMLALASAARRLVAPAASLVYECLDVHQLMLAGGRVGTVMRSLERRLMAGVALLVVSSPAFIREYFKPRQDLGGRLQTPWRLVENKVYGGADADRVNRPAPGPPWKIGWFGAIRCARSLDILTDLARRRPDLADVTVRGRPSYTEFEDFDAQTRATTALRFGGPYRPEALPALYGNMHFTWAIDYFEAGANSSWLLPNRIYEGGLHGCVPVAVAGVETSAWLARHDLGVILDKPTDIEAMLEGMTTARYEALSARAGSAPASLFRADQEECRGLVAALAEAGRTTAKRGLALNVEAAG
ncbi:glycosyl transferase family 1 [Caulobacter sp. DWR1-3-2b1]|uniref:glycosyl transferase family 1 n=1 Tax=Caulobacter sp. DWR1-3-2b1 TaxID=2804670 RepID=UPI003CFA5335